MIGAIVTSLLLRGYHSANMSAACQHQWSLGTSLRKGVQSHQQSAHTEVVNHLVHDSPTARSARLLEDRRLVESCAYLLRRHYII